MERAAVRKARQAAHFAGASAIVTGGASGIGKALATELAARGATVLVADIDEPGAEAVAEALRGGGGGRRAGAGTGTSTGTASATALDVTDPDAVAGVVEGFAAEHGGLDFLFNNAGIGIGGEAREMALAHWRRLIDVNLLSVVHGVAAAYPAMIEQGRGHIVNTASLSGLVPSPLLVPYSTTKHAVVGLSIGLRVEAAAHGVRVSVVCPGVIDTPLLDRANPDDLPHAESMPDIRDLLTRMVGRPYPASSLAHDVLDGVALDRAIIVSPRHARRVWAAYRVAPGLLIDQSARRVRSVTGPRLDRDR